MTSFGIKGIGPTLTSLDTSALTHVPDAYPMPSVALGLPPVADRLYHGYADVDVVPAELYQKYDVKRGLRNADGSGVLVGLTTISNVHGYNKVGGTVVPDEGDLIIRGYRIDDLVAQTHGAGRFGYEEVAYLLVSGRLPNVAELADFNARIDSRRELPTGYLSLFPRTTESSSIMNVLARSTLLLYAFDEDPDSTAAQHEIDVALSLLARLPRIAAIAHEASVSVANGDKLLVPPVRQGYSMAETLLDVLRGAEGFTREEAMMLDVMLMLHAEHGGGNNSTFTTRVLSSSGTDAYSTYAAAMGSPKGPKHGGANAKVGAMIEDVAAHVLRWDDDDELASYLERIAAGEAFDGTGLVYGMGHAVYTMSDPRAQILKTHAKSLAYKKGYDEEYELLCSIERLAPQVFAEEKHGPKKVCANVDLFSGLIYRMLSISEDLYTPLFAIARVPGWCAHRVEEVEFANRIIRPAYKYLGKPQEYVPLEKR